MKTVASNVQSKPRFYIAKRHSDEPFVNCLTVGKTISNLIFTVELEPIKVSEEQKTSFSYRAFFINESNEVISDIKEIVLNTDVVSKITFTLSPKMSSAANCMLALQSLNDGADELQQLISFEVNVLFTSEFDF